MLFVIIGKFAKNHISLAGKASVAPAASAAAVAFSAPVVVAPKGRAAGASLRANAFLFELIARLFLSGHCAQTCASCYQWQTHTSLTDKASVAPTASAAAVASVAVAPKGHAAQCIHI